MKIDEKLVKMKSQMRKVLEQRSSYSKEEAIKLLEEVGLSNDSAVKLLQAYGEMESAKKTAQNVWNIAWNSSNEVGIDYSTDIRKSSDTEDKMTQYFDSVYSRCAFLMVLKTIEPNEINEELLDKLYEEKISENDITNPVLKTTYHYYSESKAKDKQLNQALRREQNLTEQLHWVEGNYTNLNDKFKILKTSYEKLQTKFQERIALDEKHYQAAISQVETLKSKLKQMQERGFFKIIGDKLTGLFANTKKLNESTSELPKTLLQTKGEKIGMQEFDGNEMIWANSKDEIEQTTEVNRTDDELQQ